MTTSTGRRAILATIAVVGAELALAGSFVLASATGTMAHARAEEDSPSWSCVDDGNRICGPGNANGAPAGCYDDGGVMVAPWPCYVVVDGAGNGDAFFGAPMDADDGR